MRSFARSFAFHNDKTNKAPSFWSNPEGVENIFLQSPRKGQLHDQSPDLKIAGNKYSFVNYQFSFSSSGGGGVTPLKGIPIPTTLSD
ncbi:hypothetical protein [Chlamydia vaughanii]|uniref:hypothetical protein n=1 Tax=Chlamydia vaughanii TaxID=3112552 RepID=UPI0032B306A4